MFLKFPLEDSSEWSLGNCDGLYKQNTKISALNSSQFLEHKHKHKHKQKECLLRWLKAVNLDVTVDICVFVFVSLKIQKKQ